MAGIRLPPDDSDISHARAPINADLVSDDDRSVAADSWSIKSDYGSTLDDEQRHADASDALASGNFRTASDYKLVFVKLYPYLFFVLLPRKFDGIVEMKGKFRSLGLVLHSYALVFVFEKEKKMHFN